MYLQSLELSNFRSFPTGRFEFSPEVNIFYGPNASGKTNLLEAIYMLSNLRSFRTHLLRDMIRWEDSQAYIRGVIQTKTRQHASYGETEKGKDLPEENEARPPVKKIAVRIEPHVRVSFIHSKQCKSSKEYLQILPSTAFIPDDLSLVKGMPASRRFFLDKGTFQYYPPYWSFLTDYNRILRQKNALLRELKGGTAQSSLTNGESDPCDIWNTQLQDIGSKIILHRMKFVEHLRKFLSSIYSGWLGDKEQIDVRYKSSIRVTTEDFPNLLDAKLTTSEETYDHIFRAYGEAIQKNLKRECHLGTTVIGPHRDDLDIKLSGKPLRAFGSQGQQRTAVLALKFAEVYLYFERYTEYSLLLLDDVTSELDFERSSKLLESLQHGMQVFISTTSKPNFSVDRSLSCAHFDLSKSNT
jgi:DNA replication and repair protein RecF